MKKIPFSLLIIAFFSSFIFQSCLDDDDNNYNYDLAIGTLQKDADEYYFLQLDNDKKLLARDSSVIHYRKAGAGQRVLAQFSYLDEQPGDYEYSVRIDDVYKILTKPVIRITPEKEDSIADDKIEVINYWVSKNYLNIEYQVWATNDEDKPHMLNLVEVEDPKDPEEGYASLEFRHNSFDDPQLRMYSGIVSFDLSALGYQPGAPGLKGIKVRVNSIYQEHRTYKINYDKQTDGDKKIAHTNFSLITE